MKISKYCDKCKRETKHVRVEGEDKGIKIIVHVCVECLDAKVEKEEL